MSEAPNPRTRDGPLAWAPARQPTRRSSLISVRCTAKDHAVINEAATNAGLSIGAYLRALALGSPGPRAVRRPPIERKELARLLGPSRQDRLERQPACPRLNRDRLSRAVGTGRQFGRRSAEMRDALMKALGRGD